MDNDDDKKKKKKKKRNGIDDLLEEGGAALEALSDQCTILDNLEKRCKGVDALSGDLHQDLLPACGVHQLCYLCVSIYLKSRYSSFVTFLLLYFQTYRVLPNPNVTSNIWLMLKQFVVIT